MIFAWERKSSTSLPTIAFPISLPSGAPSGDRFYTARYRRHGDPVTLRTRAGSGTTVEHGSRREHPSVAPSNPGTRTSSVRSDP